jgi:hypothetical protein
MKKVATLMMVLFLLVGCGSGVKSKLENVSDKVYTHAVEVVEMVDEYLEDKVKWEDVSDKILNPEIVYETAEEKAVEKVMLKVWDGIFIYYGNKDETLKSRNELAEMLKIDTEEK